MNLHGIVRGAITSVNPDVSVSYIASTGSTTAAGGKVTATFASPVTITAQVQAVSTEDLQHYEYLNAQGIFRCVYLYGQINGLNRVAAKGGDLLKFPEVPAGTVRTWLVKDVAEQWPDWCRVIVALQLDPNNP